ncbi:hypothetical protein MHU86_19216 [Fragilaria crotonensis]|nr:hypothetical protein MHU86_19216 [Fragilaria crotonensis]
MSITDSVNDPNFIIFTSSLFSLAGASLILRFIGTKRRLKLMYNRLVFGIASVDLVYALHFIAFSMTISEEARQPGAACSYQGFIHTVCVLPSIYYNGFLSIHFMIAVCYNSKEKLLEKLEPYMHAFCLGVPLLVGCLNLGFGVFGPGIPDAYSCWIILPNDPPVVCDINGECHTPYSSLSIIAANVAIWFQMASGFITGGLLTINSFLIYRKARALSNANSKHITVGPRKATPGQKYVKQVINQSFLYVGGYCMIYAWIVTITFASMANPVQWGPSSDFIPVQIARLMFDIFFPLSGFYTACVFFRPRLLRWRSQNKSRSWFFAFRMTLTSLDAPRTVDNDVSRQNNSQPTGATATSQSLEISRVQESDGRLDDDSSVVNGDCEPVDAGDDDNV